MNSHNSDNKGDLESPGTNDNSLMNCEQASQYLCLSESYVRKAVVRRTIPFVRIGKRTLFRRSDLENWIEEHLVPTRQEIGRHAISHAASALLKHKGGDK
jgi:excisionase family DNA binding protein